MTGGMHFCTIWEGRDPCGAQGHAGLLAIPLNGLTQLRFEAVALPWPSSPAAVTFLVFQQLLSAAIFYMPLSG